jgi:hypothetical protein
MPMKIIKKQVKELLFTRKVMDMDRTKTPKEITKEESFSCSYER